MRVPLSMVGVALGLVAIAVQNALIAWPGFVLLATQSPCQPSSGRS